eukprot:GHRR01026490.1.p1 GENE.GHRR01026490.1~~GHRR01026490.1.p1  ORF type:complete len:248 (+),score=64.58 GHRR01026490.1:163-906(+)
MAAAQSNADSQDSELAAILDDELFGNVGAAGADGVGAAVAVEGPLADNAAVVPLKIAGTEEQPAKRARPNYYNGIIVGDTNLAADTAEKASICPPHPGWWMDMCIRCGAVRTSRDMEPAAPTGPAGPGAAGMQPATTLIKHLHHKQALEVCNSGTAQHSSAMVHIHQEWYSPTLHDVHRWDVVVLCMCCRSAAFKSGLPAASPAQIILGQCGPLLFKLLSMFKCLQVSAYRIACIDDSQVCFAGDLC